MRPTIRLTGRSTLFGPGSRTRWSFFNVSCEPITYVSKLMGAKDKGYRALTNIGSDGGQEVPHLHFHIFAGEKIGKMVS